MENLNFYEILINPSYNTDEIIKLKENFAKQTDNSNVDDIKIIHYQNGYKDAVKNTIDKAYNWLLKNIDDTNLLQNFLNEMNKN